MAGQISKTEDATESSARELTVEGKTFAFFGGFSFWPSYHPGAPSTVAKLRGGILREEVDEELDYLVIGDRRGPGKTEAKKQAEKLRAKAERAKKKGEQLKYPQILDESDFREMVRIDLTGKSFCFFGGFDCCGGVLDESLLTSMVDAVGGLVFKNLDEKLDYVVMGNRKGEGKIAANNLAKKMVAAGFRLKILDEVAFLELIRTDHDEKSIEGKMAFATFISRLHGTVDTGKLGRALKMLKQEAFKLYVRKDSEHVVGVVRSQTNASKVYASWLTPEGKYGCATLDLEECMGLQGNICKHLLVLIVGLTGAGEMDAEQAFDWLKASQGKRPRANSTLIADTFIQYKGAEIGEIDWRPTETIPEDYYAF
jgi:BRCT domain type II-containing protein